MDCSADENHNVERAQELDIVKDMNDWHGALHVPTTGGAHTWICLSLPSFLVGAYDSKPGHMGALKAKAVTHCYQYPKREGAPKCLTLTLHAHYPVGNFAPSLRYHAVITHITD